jgi:hypothetical protein
MSDTGTPINTKLLIHKRVGGVPVLYLASAAVILLAFYAWKAKTKPSITPTAVTVAADSTTAAGGYTNTGALFPAANLGTVVVAPAAIGVTPSTPSTSDPATITSNDVWLSKGVAYLGTKGVSGGAAQAALQAYLTDNQLSTVQGTYRDQVISSLGLPPYPPTATIDRPLAAEGYYRAAGTPAVWAYQNGKLQFLSFGEFQALGAPDYTTVTTGNPIWQAPVIPNMGMNAVPWAKGL